MTIVIHASLISDVARGLFLGALIGGLIAFALYLVIIFYEWIRDTGDGRIIAAVLGVILFLWLYLPPAS